MLKIPAWLGVLLLAGLVLVPVPSMGWLSRYPLFAAVLENSAHPVVFALLALVARRVVQRPWVVFGLAAVLGGATEITQYFIGRDASWVDFGNDLLGAGFVLAGRWWLSGLCAVLAAAPMVFTLVVYGHRAAAFPVLWQDGDWLDRPFVSVSGPPYPGFSLDEPSPDWRGFRVLAVEAENLSEVAVEVTLRVHDGKHRLAYTDRYNEAFRLGPRSRQVIEVPVAKIRFAPQGREMDLADIRGVMLFQAGGAGPSAFTVIAVRLMR